MIEYYCWFKHVGRDDFDKIVKNSSICGENDCKYDEKNGELCMLTSQNKLLNNHVDDIFNNLQSILDKKLECHIKVHDAKTKTELSVIQQNGNRSIK